MGERMDFPTCSAPECMHHRKEVMVYTSGNGTHWQSISGPSSAQHLIRKAPLQRTRAHVTNSRITRIRDVTSTRKS